MNRPTVALVGLDESGRLVVRSLLEQLGVPFLDTDVRDAARRGCVVVSAERRRHLVAAAIATRHGVDRSVALATWDRRRHELARFAHDGGLVLPVDADRLAADPTATAAALAAALSAAGLAVQATLPLDPAPIRGSLDPVAGSRSRVYRPAPHVAAVRPASSSRGRDQPSPRSRYTVVVLANVAWRTRRQRPQHLARTFADHGHRVFYLSATAAAIGHEEEVEPGVVEVGMSPTTRPFDQYAELPDADILEEWMRALDALRTRNLVEEACLHVHLQTWTPLALSARERFGWKVLYDCMDEWDGFPGMGRALLDAERALVQEADLVVTTAETLHRKWAPAARRCVTVRNGVDADRFAVEAVPSEVLAGVRHPIIGYTGALAEWVDYELIASAARARPEWTFVLVGDVFVAREALAGLDRLPNVLMPGLQPFEMMPRYLFWFDVALIPFLVDPISAAVDPVKFWEYVAAGLPVVATPLPEIREHRHLYHEADGAEAFVAAIEDALEDDREAAHARRALARANTWAARYRSLDAATAALWPSLSVVVVTYGQLALTRRCLETLLDATSHPALQVIVVDNGSDDGTPAYLRWIADRDERVVVVENRVNEGFAAANNRGLEIATGDVLVLLNNDTELTPGWHVPLLRHLTDPTIGLVGPRSDNVGNSARVDVPWSDAPDLHDVDRLARALRERRAGARRDIRMLAMFCVAMRREVYEAVGPLDEGYGIGLFEDDDYAERVRAAGWRVVCADDAFVRHVGQGTFRTLLGTPAYDALWAANQARFEARWGAWRAQSESAG